VADFETHRTLSEVVVFRRPFRLRGWAEPQPAGSYRADTEEELLESLSFPAWRRVTMTLTAEAGPVRQAIPIDPQELAAIRAADAGD
jgi:hypothetical protein